MGQKQQSFLDRQEWPLVLQFGTCVVRSGSINPGTGRGSRMAFPGWNGFLLLALREETKTAQTARTHSVTRYFMSLRNKQKKETGNKYVKQTYSKMAITKASRLNAQLNGSNSSKLGFTVTQRKIKSKLLNQNSQELVILKEINS